MEHGFGIVKIHVYQIVDLLQPFGQGISVDIEGCRRLAEIPVAGKIGMEGNQQLCSVFPVIPFQL